MLPLWPAVFRLYCQDRGFLKCFWAGLIESSALSLLRELQTLNFPVKLWRRMMEGRLNRVLNSLGVCRGQEKLTKVENHPNCGCFGVREVWPDKAFD